MHALHLSKMSLPGLDERFTEQEILSVIRSMLQDKAPAPMVSPSASCILSGILSDLTLWKPSTLFGTLTPEVFTCSMMP
jgi:hypothetical protein